MKNTWVKIASILQIITGLVHGLSLFTQPTAQNDTEQELINLMYSYPMNLGAGFTPTMGDLFLALSSCFSLMYLMTGLMNYFLLRQSVTAKVWKGLLIIQVIFFGAGFIMMASFTFLPPIILTGLVFIFLLVGYFMVTTANEFK